LFNESNNPFSSLFLRHIGEELYIPGSPDRVLCHHEMSTGPIIEDNRFAAPLLCHAFQEGVYRIEGATVDASLGPWLNHPLTLQMFYQIRVDGELVLVEVPAYLLARTSSGSIEKMPAPVDRAIIRPLPRLLSDIGRWPHLLFLWQKD
jgi:hypothetical protein